jgi:hypothetical protein
MKLIGDQKVDKIKSIDLKEIDQFDAFRKIIGYTPVLGEYYLSILRTDDKTPGCRYELYKGILYFVDNKGFDGKIAFHLLDVIKTLYKTDIYGAYEMLRSHNVEPKKISHNIINKKIQIRIIPKHWTEDNIFTKRGKIPIDYLKHQPAYSVHEYWANSKKDSRLKKSLLYDPNKYETIAYHFSSNNIKLYWPTIEDGKLKFYANISNDDIFGEHRYEEYVGDDLFIVKSGKDDFVVNYHLGLNSLALQSETAALTEKFLNMCLPFKNIYIWYDNDKTGKDYANLRGKELKEIFPDKNIYLIFVPNNKKGVKDPFDIVDNDWDLLTMFELMFNNKIEINER